MCVCVCSRCSSPILFFKCVLGPVGFFSFFSCFRDSAPVLKKYEEKQNKKGEAGGWSLTARPLVSSTHTHTHGHERQQQQHQQQQQQQRQQQQQHQVLLLDARRAVARRPGPLLLLLLRLRLLLLRFFFVSLVFVFVFIFILPVGLSNNGALLLLLLLLLLFRRCSFVLFCCFFGVGVGGVDDRPPSRKRIGFRWRTPWTTPGTLEKVWNGLRESERENK